MGEAAGHVLSLHTLGPKGCIGTRDMIVWGYTAVRTVLSCWLEPPLAALVEEAGAPLLAY